MLLQKQGNRINMIQRTVPCINTKFDPKVVIAIRTVANHVNFTLKELKTKMIYIIKTFNVVLKNFLNKIF